MTLDVDFFSVSPPFCYDAMPRAADARGSDVGRPWGEDGACAAHPPCPLGPALLISPACTACLLLLLLQRLAGWLGERRTRAYKHELICFFYGLRLTVDG